MKYEIEISETLQTTITVEADTPEQAMSKVMNDYDNGLIVLNKEKIRVSRPTFKMAFARKDMRPRAGSMGAGNGKEEPYDR